MERRPERETNMNTSTLIATTRSSTFVLVDPDGGVWWPHDECETEAEVRAAYEASPMAGTWGC